VIFNVQWIPRLDSSELGEEKGRIFYGSMPFKKKCWEEKKIGAGV
jgi:hypothetical protein